MIYLKREPLPIEEYSHPREMYPELEKNEKDIIPARYREVYGERYNRDICALPPLLSGRVLMKNNVQSISCCNAENSSLPSKSDRLHALSMFKDEVKVFMPWHENLEQRFYECLLSAYRNRSSGTLNEESTDVLSVAHPIATSVQNMSLIGTAGSGKSTAVRMMLDRYPRCIQHKFDGKTYHQVPVLETVAHKGDRKSIYVALAERLDLILGTNIYEKMMSAKKTVPLMENYLTTLIRQFHVGIIVIDEIQHIMRNKESMFESLLSITASSSVSVMIIGTESAVKELNKNEWFSRRFSHLGRISSDFETTDNTMETIIGIIWNIQCTKKRRNLTKKIITILQTESCRNIDLLTTIFITAQYLCIKSEGTHNELELDENTIMQAAAQYPMAKSLLADSKEELAPYYYQKKQYLFDNITREAKAEQNNKQRILMQESADFFISKAKMEAEIIDIAKRIGFTDEKTIKNIIRLESATDGFLSLDIQKQANKVLAKLFDNNYNPEKKKCQKPVPKDSSITNIADSVQERQSDYGLGMLQSTLAN